LIPFVIDPESAQTIPPLEAVPSSYVVRPDEDGEDLGYQNVPLPPVPVLSPPLVHFLLTVRDVETEFIDGDNVYSANMFGPQEGRRLLRRALGCLHDEMAAEGGDVDIVACEADGFLITKQRRPGAATLEDQVRSIIARMNGEGLDPVARRAIRSRLATFYRHAMDDVLAPASVSYESRDNLAVLLPSRDIDVPGTHEERFRRLATVRQDLAAMIAAVARRPSREQEVMLTLMEHRVYDPVLQRLACLLGTQGYHVRAFREPAELLASARRRPMRFFRLELMSLLKSINEHPLGGFLASNEALRTVYAFLVTTLQRALREMGVDPACEIQTFRRWGDFYFTLDRAITEARDICATIERAFARATYIAIERWGRHARAYSATLLPAPPAPDSTLMVMPLIPVVAADVPVFEDILSMPIEQPGPHRLRALDARFRRAAVPDLDIAFLADWSLNARDVNRGIPRLVGLLHATEADIAGLAGLYESYVSRKHKVQYRIRREAEALRVFSATVQHLIARSRSLTQ
jgi:hypothetical protein